MLFRYSQLSNNARRCFFISRFSSGGLCVRGQLNNRWSRLHEASKEQGLCGRLPSLVQNHHNNSSTFLRHDVLQHMHFQLLQEKQVNPRYSERGYTFMGRLNQSMASGVMFETYFATTFPPLSLPILLFPRLRQQTQASTYGHLCFQTLNFYWRPSWIGRGYIFMGAESKYDKRCDVWNPFRNNFSSLIFVDATVPKLKATNQVWTLLLSDYILDTSTNTISNRLSFSWNSEYVSNTLGGK